MKLVVGLGNPGARYHGTRHNIGFAVIDELARRAGVVFEAARTDALVARIRSPADALLVKPLTFMNLSGVAVGDLVRFYKVPVEDLLIVVDEAALPLGRLRARPDGSAGGHNGLKSIIEQLGVQAFARLRVGVGRGDTRRDLADHVLARFTPDEHEAVAGMTSRAADAAERFLVDGIAAVMNTFNGAEPPGDETAE